MTIVSKIFAVSGGFVTLMKQHIALRLLQPMHSNLRHRAMQKLKSSCPYVGLGTVCGRAQMYRIHQVHNCRHTTVKFMLHADWTSVCQCVMAEQNQIKLAGSGAVK